MHSRKAIEFVQRDELTSLPSASECIAHLKLMTAFFYLREDISDTKNLFVSDDSPSGTTTELHNARWTMFVARAASRYETWFLKLASKQSITPIRTDVLASKSKLEKYMASVEALDWTSTPLPPLDVLMVLHAAMLNPRWFAEDCLRHGMMALWKAGFPWQLINDRIDEDTFEYRAPPTTVSAFTSNTGLSWDNQNDDEAKLLHCAICSTNSVQKSDANPGSSDEQTLLYRLPCQDQEHLERLKVARLEKDLLGFNVNHVPLRGTILDHRGLITPDVSLRPERGFCGRLFSAVPISRTQPGSSDQSVTQYFKSLDEMIASNRFAVRKSKQKPLSATLTTSEKYSLERAKLSYSEGITDFSIDLAAAVLRQGTFVQQMRDIDWIHGPALEDITSDLIDRYEIFLQIMRNSKSSEYSVPTLAVDLAWHTHQLTPAQYYHYGTDLLKSVFFDHDDRVSEGDLTPAFQRTSERYKKLTDGLDYSECLCWHCAAQNEVKADPSSEGLSDEQLEAKAQDVVRAAQAFRFDQDYQRALRKDISLDRGIFAEQYKWAYPSMAPVVAASG